MTKARRDRFDFSKESGDFRERLREKLRAAEGVPGDTERGLLELTDDELELVSAAGVEAASMEKKPKKEKNGTAFS